MNLMNVFSENLALFIYVLTNWVETVKIMTTIDTLS